MSHVYRGRWHGAVRRAGRLAIVALACRATWPGVRPGCTAGPVSRLAYPELARARRSGPTLCATRHRHGLAPGRALPRCPPPLRGGDRAPQHPRSPATGRAVLACRGRRLPPGELRVRPWCSACTAGCTAAAYLPAAAPRGAAASAEVCMCLAALNNKPRSAPPSGISPPGCAEIAAAGSRRRSSPRRSRGRPRAPFDDVASVVPGCAISRPNPRFHPCRWYAGPSGLR